MGKESVDQPNSVDLTQNALTFSAIDEAIAQDEAQRNSSF
jgi:hypothetical protein